LKRKENEELWRGEKEKSFWQGEKVRHRCRGVRYVGGVPVKKTTNSNSLKSREGTEKKRRDRNV